MADLKPKRLQGTLIRLHEQGFAFVHVKDHGDFYVHINEMRDRKCWEQGAVVSFLPGVAKGGKCPPGYDVCAVGSSGEIQSKL